MNHGHKNMQKSIFRIKPSFSPMHTVHSTFLSQTAFLVTSYNCDWRHMLEQILSASGRLHAAEYAIQSHILRECHKAFQAIHTKECHLTVTLHRCQSIEGTGVCCTWTTLPMVPASSFVAPVGNKRRSRLSKTLDTKVKSFGIHLLTEVISDEPSDNPWFLSSLQSMA